MPIAPSLMARRPFREMIRDEPILVIDLLLCTVLASAVVGLLVLALG